MAGVSEARTRRAASQLVSCHELPNDAYLPVEVKIEPWNVKLLREIRRHGIESIY